MNNNKLFLILIALSVLQSALLFKLVGKDGTDASMVSANQEANLALPDTELNHTSSVQVQNNNLNQAQLRAIIRQELSAVLAQKNRTAYDSSVKEKQYQNNGDSREIVDREINQLKAKGVVSQTDIETFNAQIAKLAPNERTSALSRLAKAINNGELKVSH